MSQAVIVALYVVVPTAAAVLGWIFSARSERRFTTLTSALLGVVLTIALDTRLAVKGHAAETSRLAAETERLEYANERVNAAVNILGLVFKSSDDSVLHPVVYGIVDARRQIAGRNNVVLEQVFEQRLRALVSALGTMTQGGFEVDDAELFRAAGYTVHSAKRTIDATSYVNASEWWDTDAGRAYLIANRDAISRRVRIRRVFIVESFGECGRVAPLLAEQIRDGIQVFVVDGSQLPVRARADVIIVDDLFAGRMSTDGRTPRGARFFSDTFQVRQTADTFEQILARASNFGAGGCEPLRRK